ncbi:MAG TPA: G/U mismatch-specific DNA glycosylase [Acidimicrobiales bacterium]|nr:G/U mismatch-specific DNA glycosylase [Acidimicrobiales bacterium]
MPDGRPGTGADRPASAGIPDLVGPGLRVLFCGINPGLRSAELGLHFGGRGNRFWKVLYGAGFTDRVLDPSEQAARLPALGIGITNLVERPTAAAAELGPDELRAGARALEERVSRLAPEWVAFVGVQAYRQGFGRRAAAVGEQPERLGPAGLWVLPNPSGMQAHYSLADMIDAYAGLKGAIEEGRMGASGIGP